MKFTQCPPFLSQLILQTLTRIFIYLKHKAWASCQGTARFGFLHEARGTTGICSADGAASSPVRGLSHGAQAGPGWWQGQAPLTAWWSSYRARCQVQSNVNPEIQSASQDYLHHDSEGTLGQRVHQWGTLVMLVRAVKACWHTPGPWKRPSEFCKFLCKAFCLMAKAASHFFRVFTAAFCIDGIADGFSWENTTITQTKKCARSFALNWISQFSYNPWLSLS